jgi:putative tryptophan/tyrosine transport system substrate-binding protein
VRRREFITLIGGAATAWPLVARAQQPAMPVIGFLNSASADSFPDRTGAFRQGLSEAGYIEGQNITIEYRWANGQNDRVPGLAAELVARQVAVIMANYPPVLAAKTATATIPIVFTSAADPVKAGLVASFNRPGGNVTGVHLIGSALESKRLEFLVQLVPGVALIGVLVNPKNPDANVQLRDLQDAAGSLKRQIHVVRASTEPEIDTAFATVAQQGAGALLVGGDPFFSSQRVKLVALAAHYKLPTIYNQSDFVEKGGLISYGTDFTNGYRLAATYVAKILKGAKPDELPVMQPTKFELVINVKTAKALGLTVPDKLLALADQVVE